MEQYGFNNINIWKVRDDLLNVNKIKMKNKANDIIGDMRKYKEEEQNVDYKFTIFSDLHYGYANYNVFACTDGMKKLNAILKDTSSSRFYIELGDFADNLAEKTDRPYSELQEELKKHGIIMYNGSAALQSREKYMYGVIGNHEAAYVKKDLLKPYTPVGEQGNIYAFVRDNTLFVGYDALFSAETGTDDPAAIIATLRYIIPQSVLQTLKETIAEKFSPQIGAIIGFSHINLKNIEESSVNALLQVFTSFRVPVYIFEGHAHVENVQIFENGGVSAYVFTLPAVTDYDTYNYYDVFMKNGKPIRIFREEKKLIK